MASKDDITLRERVASLEASAGRIRTITLATWAGIIIAFLGLVGGAVVSSLISNQDRIEKAMLVHLAAYNTYMYNTALLDGRQTEKIQALEQAAAILSALQKSDIINMRDSAKDIQRDFKEDLGREATLLDERLQREMADKSKPLEERLKILEEQQKIIRDDLKKLLGK